MVSGSETSGDQAVEEIVVVGKRPGPPLWKVMNGEHTLFVFGSLEPLPKSLEWDSESVDWIIEHSQEFIAAPGVGASTSNPFRAISALREMSRLEKLPSGQTLRDVLQEDVYQAFLDAKNRYAPKNRKIMTLRPMFAAQELSSAALESVGLVSGSPIPKYMLKVARKHDLTITDTRMDMPIDEALTVLREISASKDQSCLETVLHSIRSDLLSAVERTRAWIDGSVALLAEQTYPNVEQACTHAKFDGPKASKARQEARELWLAAAQRALAQNVSTISILPMGEIFAADGLLEMLRRRGYVVSGTTSTR
jgi:uncharacterized protein YbaP (TraB family)